jgi:hypothetical protein
MLLVLPIPTLINLKASWRLKIRLCLLCALGLLIIAVTVIRLPINSLNATLQTNRTTWASTELVTSAIVANAPIIYGAFRKWRQGPGDTTADVKESYGDSSYRSGTWRLRDLNFRSVNPEVSWSPSGPNNKLEDDEELMFPIQGTTQASIQSTHDHRDGRER